MFPLLSSGAAPDLNATLNRMDKAGTAFRSMTASFQRVQHIAAINEDSRDAGTMAIKRVKRREMRMLVSLVQPDKKYLAVQGRKAEIYYPNMNTVQEMDLGKNRGLLDQFFLIGFGTSRAELEAAYTIRSLGEEPIEAQPASHLELIPKSPEVLQHLRKLELWISDTSGYPLQQKFFLKGDDSWLVTYSKIETADLPDSALKLQLPKNVKRENLQK
jgi:outer membrane lipoprotein-sorting protein